MFLIKVNVFYLLLWYLIRSSMANDFCESFAKNNFSIDYGFGSKHLRRTDPMFAQLGAFVIEDNLWTFEVHMKNGSIDLVTNDIALALGLTKETKTAFIDFEGNLGLIDKNGSIHMKSFADSNETTDKFNFKEKIEFNETGNRLYIPFTFNISSDSMIIGFVAQNFNSNINQFERVVTYYHIKGDNSNKTNFDPDSFEITKIINNLDKSIEIMAIFGPYLMKYHLISNTTKIGRKPSDKPINKNKNGFLILIKVNKSIQYFFTSDNITNEYKTLIDCNHIKDKLDFEYRNKSDSNSSDIWPKSGDDSNHTKNLDYMLTPIIILVYIFILSALICLCCIFVDMYRLGRRLWFKKYSEMIVKYDVLYDCENPEEVVPEAIIEPIPEVLVEQLWAPFVGPKILVDKEAEV